jgi:hypothetical protein
MIAQDGAQRNPGSATSNAMSRLQPAAHRSSLPGLEINWGPTQDFVLG